jgi:negative regulator of sigma E activity
MESEVNRNIEEQLSAFLDGELSADELQLLVRRLERNEDYRATLASYATIGGLLRNDGSRGLADQLRRNVMAALEDDREAAASVDIASTEPVSGQSWFRPAVAAGVVAIAIAGILNLNPTSTEQPDLVRQAAVAPQVAEPAAARVAAAPQVEADSQTSATWSAGQKFQRRPVDQRMFNYLVSHGEYARSFQGTMMDSRVFVQQASYEE